MTVRELIESLKRESPEDDVVLHFRHYNRILSKWQPMRPGNYNIGSVGLAVGKHQVWLTADPKGDYY